MPVNAKNKRVYGKKRIARRSIIGRTNNGNIFGRGYRPSSPKPATPPNQGSSVMPSIKIVGVDKSKK